MGKHSIRAAEEPSDGTGGLGGWQGRRRRADGGRRGVSAGVIVALVTVVVLVGGIILWRFFGQSLSRRSDDAAEQCVQGSDTVAVVADPSIAEPLATLAERFNADVTPVGDKCVKVVVTAADSEAVLSGLTASWPPELGSQPALWLPASSIQSARLQAAAGKQIVSDDRSLVTSPVVLAVRPELTAALGQDGWSALPSLQSDPNALDSRNLPGWGALRLAVPAVGAADAKFLAAEAVATTSAPAGGPPTAGLGAVNELLAAQPALSGNSAQQAWDALVCPGYPAAASVHGVVMTEQQLFTRAGGLANARDSVAEWVPGGPTAVADYPTMLLAGPWLTAEQVTAASEFARYLRKPEQLGALAAAGFRAPDTATPAGDVVSFPALGSPVAVADDALRTALADAVAPGAEATTTVMLNRNVAAVAGSLRDRIRALPPNAAVGLWTFDGTDSSNAVPLGPVSDGLGGQSRSAALAAALDRVSASGGGGVSFTTLRLVYADALANFRPGQPNSVLVITSGRHTDRTLDGPGLQAYVKSAVDPNRPVAINVIDVGDSQDRQVWEAVVRLSGGSYQNVPADSAALTAAVARGLG